jgi:uncharacterized membrane protein
MSTDYHTIAGQSLERLAALSDGVFAIAMTLLVLDLRVPVSTGLLSESDLWVKLLPLAPRLVAYGLSFMTLGIFWVGQQTQLSSFARSNRTLTWIHIGFLLAVSLLPFSTGLLAEFFSFRTAVVIYWLNLLMLGVMLWWSIRYAWRAGLLKDAATSEQRLAQERRILRFQALYALSMLLCVVNTYASIAGLILLQITSILAPRLRLLSRR